MTYGRPMKKLEATIDLHLNSIGEFDIRVQDSASRLIVFEGRLTPENFAKALGGRGSIEMISAEINTSENVGKKHENKTERIPIPSGEDSDEKFQRQLRKGIKKFEVDGWEADATKMNYRKYKDGLHEVTFRRYV